MYYSSVGFPLNKTRQVSNYVSDRSCSYSVLPEFEVINSVNTLDMDSKVPSVFLSLCAVMYLDSVHINM